MGVRKELLEEWEDNHPIQVQIEELNDPRYEILYDIDMDLVESLEKDLRYYPVSFYLEVNLKDDPGTIIMQSQMYDSIKELFKDFITQCDYFNSDVCNIWLMSYQEDRDMDYLASVNHKTYKVMY